MSTRTALPDSNKWTEKQAREIDAFRDKSRRLFEHIPAMVFGRNGKIINLNKAAENIFGLEELTVTGKTLAQCGYEVLDGTGRKSPRDEHPWILCIKNNKLLADTVTGIRLPNGTIRWQQSTNMPLKVTKSGKAITCITLLTDITHFKEAQAHFTQIHKMDAIGSLAAGITHDFNNVLTSIRNHTQLLLVDCNQNDSSYEILKDIENETIRGAELIKQLLIFSKPDHNPGKSSPVNETIRKIRHVFKRILPSNTKLEMHLADIDINALISSSSLEQILVNLIVNAKDAMPSGGEIKIKTSMECWLKGQVVPVSNAKPGNYARIDVSDSGTGIPQDALIKIFEPFYTTKKSSGGTGLGLSIVYNIIRRGNGHITIDSAIDKGTTFSIYLPAKHSTSVHKAKASNNEPPQVGSETILIVDDEELITKSTSRFLGRFGYKTIPVNNSLLAMDIYKHSKHDIKMIILDMEMPDVTGMQLLAEIRKDNSHVKIIAMSGHVIKEDERHPVKCGANIFIQKPFDNNQLLCTIRSLIDLARA